MAGISQRAGLGSVSPRYMEGARALGFSHARAFINVSVPIGLRLSLPGLTNTMISVVKNSALLLSIGLAELTFVVQRLSAETFRTVELFVVLGAVYLALVLALSSVMHMISRRYALGAGV
ncbi:ABC transporter permease subunit [Sinomonas sp. JGH33]|uniref:ABC transporter permease subunit n=1 Tax=Sinomonas terricola TaxID=3110330 RepID=A0ABU5T9V7_9MICC|nr:ABC transporter permease subunit [Sinomonas sp. JGH33]MEA5456305.1 ABC transporter permease subunit [Sinomonas sp. JGH33]